MVLIIARFIAHGPNNDGWMIFVPFNHTLCALYKGRSPFRNTGQHVKIPDGMEYAMTLQIGLINHIEAIFVAQLQKS
ncbi:hypothetical protein D3C74_319580 [compost metagenome]